MASSNQPQASQDLSLHHLLDPSDPNWRDWADGLPLELRALITQRLLDNDEKDYIRFRAVCDAWRKSVGDENIIDHRMHPHRWILLPEPIVDNLCQFVNVATGQHIQLQGLHQLPGHTVAKGLYTHPEGVLVLRDDSSFTIRLLNPLTRQLINLPSLKTLMMQAEHDDDSQLPLPEKQFDKELHEVTAAGFVGKSGVVLYFSAIRMLAVATPGDETWTVVTCNQSLISFATIGEHFYCLSTESLFELDATKRTPKLVVVSPIIRMTSMIVDTLRLVDNGGELLILCNELHHHPQGFWYIWCAVRKIDFDKGLMVPDYDLKDRAVFVGPCGAISVSTAEFPELDANTVYFRRCCNNVFIKQCSARSIYERYLPLPGSFAKRLMSYVTESTNNVNGHTNSNEGIAEAGPNVGL